MKTMYKVVFPEFSKLGKYGSGGWSKNAKHRPQPVRTEIITDDIVFTKGKSVIIEKTRKLKVNIYNARTGEVIRADYSTDDPLTEFGKSVRQIKAAAKKAATQTLKQVAEAAAKAEAERAARIVAAHKEPMPMDINQVRVAINTAPECVAAWVAAGLPRPAPESVVAVKQMSGTSWKQFSAVAGGQL